MQLAIFCSFVLYFVLSKPFVRIGQLEMLTTIENSNYSTNKIHTAKQIEIFLWFFSALTFFHSLWEFSHNTHTWNVYICVHTQHRNDGRENKDDTYFDVEILFSSMPLKLSIEIDIPWRLFMIHWINAGKKWFTQNMTFYYYD